MKETRFAERHGSNLLKEPEASAAAAEACIGIGSVARFLRDAGLTASSWASSSALIRAREEGRAVDMERDTAIEKVKVRESDVVAFAAARAALVLVAERLSAVGAAAAMTVSTAGLLQLVVSLAFVPSHRNDTAFSAVLLSLAPSRLLIETNKNRQSWEVLLCWRCNLNLAWAWSCMKEQGVFE